MNDKTAIYDLATKRIKVSAKIKLINADLKELKQILMEIDDNLLKEMAESKQTLTRIDGHTISVNTQELFTPTDWKEFEDFVETKKAAYLYQRRLTQKAVAEAVELYGDEVPVEKFVKRSVSVRKVPGAV